MCGDDIVRKRIVVCLECTSYDFLKKCHTPNIDSLNPHPAKSLGGMTRAAVPWLLGGFLPHCEVPGCPHNKGLRWSSPFYLSEWKRKSNLFLYIPNGWVLEFLTPFMTPEFRKKILYWHERHAEQPTGQMIEDFLQIEPKLDSYFASFHCCFVFSDIFCRYSLVCRIFICLSYHLFLYLGSRKSLFNFSDIFLTRGSVSFVSPLFHAGRCLR